MEQLQICYYFHQLWQLPAIKCITIFLSSYPISLLCRHLILSVQLIFGLLAYLYIIAYLGPFFYFFILRFSSNTPKGINKVACISVRDFLLLPTTNLETLPCAIGHFRQFGNQHKKHLPFLNSACSSECRCKPAPKS